MGKFSIYILITLIGLQLYAKEIHDADLGQVIRTIPASEVVKKIKKVKDDLEQVQDDFKSDLQTLKKELFPGRRRKQILCSKKLRV